MKKTIILTLAIATALASPSFAQTAATPNDPTTAPAQNPGLAPAPTQGLQPKTVPADPTTTASVPSSTMIVTVPRFVPGQMMASRIVGAGVYNTANEKIGDVSDIVLDTDGKVAAVVIGVGGFLGMGEKKVAVAYPSVKITKDANGYDRLVVAATKEQLKGLTAYEAQKSS